MSKSQILEVIASSFIMLMVIVLLFVYIVPGMIAETKAYQMDSEVISLESGVVVDKSFHSLTPGLDQDVLKGYFITIEGPVTLSSGDVIEATREIQVDKITWDSLKVGDMYE